MLTAIYGSARKNGNTDILADAFIREAALSESFIKRFYLRNLPFKPCTACGGCDKTGICVFDDEIWKIFESMDRSDSLLIASPITFASVTAQTKAFIDRGQAFWVRKFILSIDPPEINLSEINPSESNTQEVKPPKLNLSQVNPQEISSSGKKGFFISVGGMNTQKYFDNAKIVVKTFMVSTGFKYSGELFFPGVDKKGEILNVPGAVSAAEKAGRSFYIQAP
ncbi:MAG: flavodoxin family protein [Clostridiales bacterium]|nr:flavodoxin family protein [Clostridiales bacterium]